MRRTLPRQRLVRSPLVHVLAQVRFTPAFAAAERVQDVARRLHDLGFPRFQRSQLSHIYLDGTQASRIEYVPRWDFLDRGRQTGIIMTQDFVLLQTSLYTTFDEFGGCMKEVLGVVGDVVAPTLVERVGLRYVDLVHPRPGEQLSDYLIPGLVGYDLGAVPHLGVHGVLSRIDTSAETEHGRLAIRCFQRDDGSFLPPDLWPSVLTYQTAVKPGDLVSILDLDHSSATPLDFDVGAVMMTFGDLHDALDIAFRGAVTPFAMQQWGKEQAP